LYNLVGGLRRNKNPNKTYTKEALSMRDVEKIFEVPQPDLTKANHNLDSRYKKIYDDKMIREVERSEQRIYDSELKRKGRVLND
jgi:hypothetical protein